MKNKKFSLPRNRKLLIIAILALVIVCCVVFLGKTIVDLIHNKKEFKRLTRQSAQLDKEHDALLKRLELLHTHDRAYLERLARVQYHMSAPGETEFRFPKE